MPPADYKQLRLSTIGDVLLIEVMSPDVQGPDRAKEFIAELTAAVNHGVGPILVDLHRTSYFSSMGYAALFKLVKFAKERNRPIRFCALHPDIYGAAEIVGLGLVVESHDCRQTALEAFARSDETSPGTIAAANPV